jgi:acetyl-CoA C-acetyltransferase
MQVALRRDENPRRSRYGLDDNRSDGLGTVQGDETPPPDQYVGIPDPFATDAEANAGIFMPVELFSVIESAIRASQGLSHDAHRDAIAQLYSDFSKVAASNPRAWSHEVLGADEIRNATDKNAMLAYPYTKKFNSQWNVNQAAAILVCSAAKAKALGLDSKRWVYPLSGTQNKHVVCLAQKKELHTQPGAVIAGQRAYALAGITPEDVTVADLYSCFPSAVQTFGRDLKLDHIPWSVSGSMAFAGGPYNHASIDSVVRIVDVIRENASQERQIGIVSNLSGIFGKQAVALFSNQPNRSSPRGKGFYFEDVTGQVAKIDPPMAVNGNYTGLAKIVGYTVVYSKNAPSHAFVYCESTAGERTVAKSLDQDLLARMMTEEFVGKTVQVNEDKTISLV